MTTNNKTVRIFMMPQQFPCGPQASCCGPIGQTEDYINALRDAIEKSTGFPVEIKDVTKGVEMKNHLPVLRLVRSFGPTALPIIAIDDEVVAMGSPTRDQAVEAIKMKINAQ